MLYGTHGIAQYNNFMVKSPCQMHHQEHHQDLGQSEENHQLTERWRANNDRH